MSTEVIEDDVVHCTHLPLRPARAWPLGSLTSVRGLSGTYTVVHHASPYGVQLYIDGESTFVGTESLVPPLQEAATEPARPARRRVSAPLVDATGDARTARGGSPRPVRASGSGEPCEVVNWDRSVPRQAIRWERLDGGKIHVKLRPGLYFYDGTTDKLFSTVRAAKDYTRAASASNAQGTLL